MTAGGGANTKTKKLQKKVEHAGIIDVAVIFRFFSSECSMKNEYNEKKKLKKFLRHT